MDNNFKYCAACLVTDVKMYSLAAKHTSNNSFNTLGHTFSRLLQIPMFEKSQHVCFECAKLMYKFRAFKTQCEKAQALLSAVIEDNPEIIRDVIKNIDRKTYKLTSNLTRSCIEFINFNIVCDNKVSKIQENYIEPNIKIENEIVQNEATNTFKVNSNVEYEGNKNMFKKEYVENIDEYDGEIEYSCMEDSLDSDLIVLVKENESPKTRKRKVKTKIKTNGIEHLCDDEPLSEVSKRLNKKVENVKIKYPKNFNVSFFEEYATVVFMTPEDAKKELLLRKESSNYKTCPFKCEFCYKGYEVKTTYENHMKRHSVESGEYECDLCHIRFPEQKFLGKHRLACHKRKFCCKLCSYICYCTHQATTHVKLHMGKKYPCSECDEVFSMPNSLAMHKRKKHVTECVCELCGSTFATARGLYFHNLKIHRQDVNNKLGPKCDDCGIHFATEMAWKKHFVLSSKHRVSNGCKHCGETFTNIEQLKSHAKIHARRQARRIHRLGRKFPTACGICNKWLSNRIEYKSHMTTEHPQSDVAKRLNVDDETPFVCEVCGQMFRMQCFLRYHQRKHTGERPFSCPECDKSYSAKSALAAHRARVHERVARAPLACRVCGRTFTWRSGLNKHMKGHLNIRPHKCTICDKAFINACDVKLHIKYVHNKVPWPKRDRTKRKDTINALSS